MSKEDDERKRVARMKAQIERQRRKNQSGAAKAKRRAREAFWRRTQDGD